MRLLTALFSLSLFAACGDDTKTATTQTAAGERIETLRYETNGGCQMMGPNCATYVVYSDGTVEIYRTGENLPAEVKGSIPAAELEAFIESIENTDFDGLLAEVGPGTCNACVDGIDAIVTITFESGPVTLDSTVVNFDPAHPLFANLEVLMHDVRAVGELEIQQRG